MHKSFQEDTESCNWLMCACCSQKSVSQTIVKFSFRLCGQYNITLQPPSDKSIFKIKPAELYVSELFYLVLNMCSHWCIPKGRSLYQCWIHDTFNTKNIKMWPAYLDALKQRGYIERPLMAVASSFLHGFPTPINHHMQHETFIFAYSEPQPSRPQTNDEWNFVNLCVSVSQKMIQSALTSYKTS
jgi:hypothetical protein